MDYFLFDFSGVQFHYTMSRLFFLYKTASNKKSLSLGRGAELVEAERGDDYQA